MDMNDLNNFRYERKFLISGITKSEIESIVKLHPALFSEIFHKRSVNNIYYDSPELNNYFDNIDGNLQRIKTRIRWYGALFDEIKKPVLELKIKKGLLGKKLSYSINSFKLDNNYNTQKIAHVIQNSEIPNFVKTGLKALNPILLNRYTRKYFLSADKKYRITIDTGQAFYRIGSWHNLFIKIMPDDTNIILELKYDMAYDNDARQITNLFPFRLTKSSKYVQGVERVFVQ